MHVEVEEYQEDGMTIAEEKMGEVWPMRRWVRSAGVSRSTRSASWRTSYGRCTGRILTARRAGGREVREGEILADGS